MKKLPIKKVISKLSSRYLEKWWVRAGVAAIPRVGGSLDIIFSHRGQELARARVASMFRFLREELEKITEEKIDRSFLESEEWTDVVILAVQKAAQVRNKERLRAIARILRSSITNEFNSGGHIENLLDVTAALRDEEAVLLREIYKRTLDGKSVIGNYGEELKDSLPGLMHDRLPFLLKRIESLGLISEQVGVILGYKGGAYTLTSTGKELCKYLVGDGTDFA